MRADCHMHMILDGYEWKGAIARHKEKPDEDFIRQVLKTYQNLGYTYLRDGGDRWNAGKRSRQIAKEYGINPYGEELCYIIGGLGAVMLPYASKFLCDCCRHK